MRRRITTMVAVVVALGSATTAGAQQTSPAGPCTDAARDRQYAEGDGHKHTEIAVHKAACRVLQQAFLPLNQELGDEVLGEIDVKAGIAAVTVSYPQAGVLFFDVTDAANPRFLSRYRSSECEGTAIDVDCGAFVDLSADGKLAFLSLQQISVVPGRPPTDPAAVRPAFPGVEVIDIADPRSPRLASPYPVASEGGVHTSRSHVVPEGPSSAEQPRAPGEYLFSTANGFGVEVSRVVRTPSPRLEQVSRIDIDEVHDMFLQDDPVTGRTYMYVAAGFSSGFYVYDVTDPAQAVRLAEWDPTPQCTEDWYSHTIDVVMRNGRRYVTMPSELFDNGETSAAEQAAGCGKVAGNGDKPGPLWIVDATDFSRLGQAGDTEQDLRLKSEAALVATWTNAAGRAGGDLVFSPHNQQVVDDRIYVSNYHAGVTVLDASGAFAGRSERPSELGFLVPAGEPTRPIYQAPAGPLMPFISKYIQARPLIWDVVYYRGYLLAADETGGFYSFRYEGDKPLPPLPPLDATATPGASAPACATTSGIRSFRVTAKGRRLRFGFRRNVNRPVGVDVFRESRGRRVTGNRLVARFKGRRKAFTWSPRGKRAGNGYYIARITMRLAGGRRDVRRVALRREGGRFTVRPDFHHPRPCGLLQTFKLERPVFGGVQNRPLGISFRVARRSVTRVEVLQAGRVVRRFPETSRRAGITHRLRLASEKLRRGDVQVRLVARQGSDTTTDVLTARRL